MSITKYTFPLKINCSIPTPPIHLGPQDLKAKQDKHPGVARQIEGLTKLPEDPGTVVQYQFEIRDTPKDTQFYFFGITFSPDSSVPLVIGFEPYLSFYRQLQVALWRTIIYYYPDGNSTIASTLLTHPVDHRNQPLAFTTLE